MPDHNTVILTVRLPEITADASWGGVRELLDNFVEIVPGYHHRLARSNALSVTLEPRYLRHALTFLAGYVKRLKSGARIGIVSTYVDIPAENSPPRADSERANELANAAPGSGVVLDSSSESLLGVEGATTAIHNEIGDIYFHTWDDLMRDLLGEPVAGESPADGSLPIYLDPGAADEDTIQAVFDALSDLHIAAGGLGLTFTPDENGVFVVEGVLQ